MSKVLLNVINLTKKYDNQHGIENISFSINEGEIVGLIGPSGSGKTTTLKCLVNLLKKDNGDIKFFDKDLYKYFTLIMQFCSYLPSEEFKYGKMTVIDFLNYSNSFYEIDYSDNIHELLLRFKLDEKRRICDLSLGEKKKVAIVNAFFTNPKILLLDEPCESLDPLMKIEFFKLVEERKKAGAAILLSSHQLPDVYKHCDRIIMINNGGVTHNLPINKIEQFYKRISFSAKKEFFDKLNNLDGVKDLVIENDRASFLFMGNINNLLKRLVSFDLDDLLIENPSIEELFLHYYNE